MMVDFESTLFAFENRFASGLKDRILIELRDLTLSLKQAPSDPKHLPSICKVLQHCQRHLSSHGDSLIKENVSHLIDVVGSIFRVYHPRPRSDFNIVSSNLLK